MKYEGYFFEVYRNRIPPYDWRYIVIDPSKNMEYNSLQSYKTEREAVQAVFETMEYLTGMKIDKENMLPKLN